WTEGTLSGRLARARKLLAERLARRGVTLGCGTVALSALAPPAAVAGELAASTVQVAILVAAGAAADALPAPVAALAQGVPTMHTAPFKLLAAGLAGVAIALGGFGLYSLTAADDPLPVTPSKPLFVVAPAPAPLEKGWVTKHTFTFKNSVTTVAFGPDLVAAGDKEGVLKLFNVKTGKEQEELSDGKGGAKPIDRVLFSPDGTQLFIITNEGDAIHLCTVDKKDRKFPGAGGNGSWKVHGITPDGGYWLQAFAGNSLAGMTNRLSENMVGGPAEAKFVHENPVQYAAGEDPNTVGTVSLGTLRRWGKGNDKPLWEVKLDKLDPTGLAVSPGGKRIAVTGDAGQVRIFDAKTGKEIAKTDKLTGPVWSAAFSPDGKQIVAGCEDKTARVYDAETG